MAVAGAPTLGPAPALGDLTGAADADILKDRLPGDRAEQRLLEEIFFRAFSHVLGARDNEDQGHHGRESLEEAVRQFNHRRDRKRSDEHFRGLFGQLIRKDTELDPRHLYLPPARQGGQP